MSDKLLRQFVVDELDFEPSIDAADIGVAVEDGVVTLSGHVADYAQKVAAERAAWRVKGVKAIAQEIELLNNENLDAQRAEATRRHAAFRSDLHKLLWQSLFLGMVVALIAVVRLRVAHRDRRHGADRRHTRTSSMPSARARTGISTSRRPRASAL